MNLKTQEMGNTTLNKNVQVVRELAKELIEISNIKQEKYPFREEYIDRLINKIRTNPGKFLIGLEDLPDYCILKFNDEGKNILNNLLNFVNKKYGSGRVNRKHDINFYLINESINKKKGGLKVGTIKKYIKFLYEKELNITNINEINKCVIQINASIKSKAIQINGLPIDLRDEKWASIFGVILDTHLKKFKFVVENRDFAEYVKSSLQKIGIEPYFQDQGNLVKIEGHAIMGYLINIAGIETNKRQLIANNHLPCWMFFCSRKYHGILLSKILDTEGYVPNGNKSIRIAQASFIDLTKDEKGFVLSNCEVRTIKPSNKESKVVIFSKLNKKLREKVLLNPSLILLSTQLLLRKYGINSKIYPIQIYISTNEIASISWHLAIIGFNEIRKFYDLCGDYISIKYKKENIKKILANQKSKCLPQGLRIVHYLINGKKIQDEKGHFTTKELIKITRKKKKTVYNTVGYLAQLNMIKVLDKERDIKLWNLTKKGARQIENVCQDKERWDYLIG